MNNAKLETEFSKLTFWQKIYWPNTLFLIITPLLVFTLTPIHIYMNGFQWKLVALFFAYSVVTSFAITAGYHRLFAHRSYEARWWVKLTYLLFGSAAFQGSVLKWSTDHRRHHRFVDTDKDPYSISKGFFYAHMGWVFLKEDPQYKLDTAPDLAKDPLVKWQDKYNVPISVVTGFIVPMGLGWTVGSPLGGLIFAGLLRVVVTQHCTFFINSFCHFVGSQPFSTQNSAKDSHVMALFTYGEGYHNYHHRFQSDYRNGIRWYDWDPTKWLIRFMSFIGWTSKLKRVPPTEILKAKVLTKEIQLIEKGVPAHHLETLKLRIDEAHLKLKHLRDEYKKMKSDFGVASAERLAQMKLEIKIARIEFKLAYRQWLGCAA